MTNPLTPIFPVPQDAALDTSLGLTKRELFAAMALQGFVSNPDLTFNGYIPNEDQAEDTYARWAVMVADALVKELNKTQE